MAKLQEPHIFTGMQRDMSASKHPAQFIYDGLNVRLTARESDTLLSITNEKGTLSTEIDIEGNYLGHCVLNQYLIVFSHSEEKDYIYRMDLSEKEETKIIYGNGDNHNKLGFSTPIKAIASFESDAIQKVYWTDGVNQPRMINISSSMDEKTDNYNSKSFDFVRELKLKEEVSVKKIVNSSGEFAPGVIQYSFTYFDKYGQETNIFHTTPLLYVSHFDRGGSPEDKISNSFQIIVEHIDENFEYLRIYSIQRTSINATPICKRVQDIEISSMGTKGNPEYKYTIFVDTGKEGDSVDPTELLYKGGEEIIAGTIEQKDGTLFLGDISLKRKSVKDIQDKVDEARSSIEGIDDWFSEEYRYIKGMPVSSNNYVYQSQLTAVSCDEEGVSDGYSVPCGYFKRGDYYRCGIQFQHKSGKWSEPVFIEDVQVENNYPQLDSNQSGDEYLKLPILKSVIPLEIINMAVDKDYLRVRPLVVFPTLHDRTVICQGVACPTLSTDKQKSENNPYAQASWFFRPYPGRNNIDTTDGSVAPIGGNGNSLFYINRNVERNNPDTPPSETSSYPIDPQDPRLFRQTEIQGHFKKDNQFKVNGEIVTLHSPDVEFDDQLAVTDFNGMSLKSVGNINIQKVFSSIDIQTESPTVGTVGSGAVNKSYNKLNNFGIVAGLYYDDAVVDDDVLGQGRMGAYPYPKQSAKFLIYPWQGTGSLNNDINRPADQGNATAILKKKVIANLRFSSTELAASNLQNTLQNIYSIKLFNFDEIGIAKLSSSDNSPIYQGNIDTSLVPDMADGVYLCCNSITASGCHKADTYIADGTNAEGDKETSIDSNEWFKTWSFGVHEAQQQGLRKWFPLSSPNEENVWAWMGDDIGEHYVDLDMKKLPVRMKYKSTPHLVFSTSSDNANSLFPNNGSVNELPIVEVRQENVTNRFGGESEDALRANSWVPCGPEVAIKYGEDASIKYMYGDTYFQRYDCLKTYPFTKEDLNQIVEIGSFMLETRVNIDGRYDKNRGQTNNINMSPQNFNLINPVYSQIDNFFSYKIMAKDFYTNVVFPNQITWTKEKTSGADVDMWTNITLASTYDMDGSKGKVEEVVAYKDQIYCFQQKGVSVILFNSRVQIPVSDGVPIEISNSYKVDGYKYLSDGIGCSDKKLTKKTPAGIYFVDSVGNHLMHISEGGLKDLAEQCNMTTWFKSSAGSIKKLLYDDINHDLYGIQEGQAICFSEKLNQFTGFYSYGNIDLIETYNQHIFTMKERNLWKMFEGNYCEFFGTPKPWSITFVSNGIAENKVGIDKTFTNIEFRASVEGDGELDDETGKFTPALPFDSLETWNEYQHGFTTLENKSGHSSFVHGTDSSSLKRKFRIWRNDIPRNNYELLSVPNREDYETEEEYNEALEAYNTWNQGEIEKGISRKIRKPLDRMRNPWLYLKFQKDAAGEGKVLSMTEIHDIVMTYFV